MAAEPEEDPSAVGEDLLPTADVEHLRHRGLRFRAVMDGNFVNLFVLGYPLPAGYDRSAVDLLIRLPAPGWPDVKADMWWTLPWVKVAATNTLPDRAAKAQAFEGESWQRWSRHSNKWRPGVDGLATFLAQIDRELLRAVS